MNPSSEPRLGLDGLSQFWLEESQTHDVLPSTLTTMSSDIGHINDKR